MLDRLERVFGGAADQISLSKYPIVAITPRSLFLTGSIGNRNLKPMRAIANWLPVPEFEKTANTILASDMEVRKGVEPTPKIYVVRSPKRPADKVSGSGYVIAQHSLEALGVVAGEHPEAPFNMLGKLLDHWNHELIYLPRNALNVADAIGMSIKLAAFKRFLDCRHRLRMLVPNKGSRHPVRPIFRAPGSPIWGSLKMRKVVGACEGQLLPNPLNLLPMAVGDLGEREHVAPDLALLALE